MENIYIVVSKTNTKMGKFIRLFTWYDYNHISISLTKELSPMYSFSRYYKNRPFTGGFTEESLLRFIERGKGAILRVYKVPISLEKKEYLKTILEEMLIDNKAYRYSVRRALIDLKNDEQEIASTNNTCLSFARSVLKKLDIIDKSIEINSIKDMVRFLNQFEFITIKLKVKDKVAYSWNKDEYMKAVKLKDSLASVIYKKE